MLRRVIRCPSSSLNGWSDEFTDQTFQMEAPEGCPAQVYTIMKDVSFFHISWFCTEIWLKGRIGKCDSNSTSSVLQAWELEPEKRPTFAASRDSLDLFRTQNPQWRRRKTFPRTSKKTWKWMPVSFWRDSHKVIITTSDESKRASFWFNNLWEKELQGLKTTSTVMVEKTWSEDEINNQNGMTYNSGPPPHQYLLNQCSLTLRVFLEVSPNFYKRNNCAQSLRLAFAEDIFEEFIPQLPTYLPHGETYPWPLCEAPPEMNCQEPHSAILYPFKAKLEPLYRKPLGSNCWE